MLVVVPTEERPAPRPSGLNADEPLGVIRMVLQGLEVRLNKRVVVRHSRPGMTLMDAQIEQQLGEATRNHGRSTVRMNGELTRVNALAFAGPSDEFPSDHLGFPRGDRPADNLATEDV